MPSIVIPSSLAHLSTNMASCMLPTAWFVAGLGFAAAFVEGPGGARYPGTPSAVCTSHHVCMPLCLPACWVMYAVQGDTRNGGCHVPLLPLPLMLLLVLTLIRANPTGVPAAFYNRTQYIDYGNVPNILTLPNTTRVYCLAMCQANPACKFFVYKSASKVGSEGTAWALSA
jgi:hypothetical protein